MKYDFTQIPPSWLYCFNISCCLKDECLRYQTGLQLPDDHLFGRTVFPTILKKDSCEFFRKDEPVVLATGFVTSNPVANSMFVALRHQLTAYLGGNGTYYLYRNGKRWLSPNQQEYIRQLFRKAGYEGDVPFARTVTGYYFLEEHSGK